MGWTEDAILLHQRSCEGIVGRTAVYGVTGGALGFMSMTTLWQCTRATPMVWNGFLLAPGSPARAVLTRQLATTFASWGSGYALGQYLGAGVFGDNVNADASGIFGAGVLHGLTRGAYAGFVRSTSLGALLAGVYAFGSNLQDTRGPLGTDAELATRMFPYDKY